MLMKTHVEKMSTFGLTTIFMKTNGVINLLHDVYDKKGAYPVQPIENGGGHERSRLPRLGSGGASSGRRGLVRCNAFPCAPSLLDRLARRRLGATLNGEQQIAPISALEARANSKPTNQEKGKVEGHASGC